MDILNLKPLMDGKGLTGKDFAEELGISPVALSNIMQGNSFPRANVLMKMADILNVEVRDLFKSSKGGKELYGFIEYDGTVHTIKSVTDLEAVLSKVKELN
ncbi:helix-turn-helix domain-containing protein [Allomuricauda sp. ARW1Y1]|jgi:transcriptional regulator with XRE-family HTH domain|uniref:helix-turn-helix domain-containing protein n=1 Tax=Allomuricauda sp. ARW1Y1 TaxID=2663843 RepID=UPI0015CDA989|nr:helix-turn-helix transcriptional regulator [Muricauda sp. ARW1Y1]NYJ26342.1 transcriptional regulator with XRE-family HTH domain [Muricauda sp. ARW1Y1]